MQRFWDVGFRLIYNMHIVRDDIATKLNLDSWLFPKPLDGLPRDTHFHWHGATECCNRPLGDKDLHTPTCQIFLS